jgi:hypothetical protein
MELVMRRFFSSHVVLLGIVTAAVVGLDIFFDVVVDPRLEERAGLLYEILAFFELAYALFLCSLLIMGVVLLLRRKLFLSVCYLVAGVVAYESSYYIEGALKDDRVIFPSASHREIAAIYRQQDVDFDLTNPKPHLVSLDDRCHPPGGCGCWVLIDPGHSSGVENDLGGWHQPTAKIFPQGELPVLFEFVNVRVLDSSAYSVLACGIDFPSFRPGW